MKIFGARRVLLNHSSQSRWSKRTVFCERSLMRANETLFFVKSGHRFVPVYRLYRDVGTEGQQRATGEFIADVRV